jgi:MGT family glycosyltransferase
VIDYALQRMPLGTVAFVAMPDANHVRSLLPLVAGVSAAGCETYVLTRARFRPEVERAGARFVDLFARHPLEDADDESIPMPCRYVTFAGHYAEAVARDIQELGATLVIYDTFATVGRVAAIELGLPYVNACAGHNMDPAIIVPQLQADQPVAISPRCHRAVATLRERHGIEDASPFSYVAGTSPFLNVYAEPPAYLNAAERRSFEPLVFHGSLPSLEEIEARRARRRGSSFRHDATLKVYVCLGTIVWRYWPDLALAALGAIAEALDAMPEVDGVISLGGADVGADAVAGLSRPNVSVHSQVDQWNVLDEADVFITHHGLNSTHEAVFHRVSMVSYPFFGDQPALAERCRELGLAVPLVDSPRGHLTATRVRSVLDEVVRRREASRSRLEEARQWELDVIAARPRVIERIVALAERGAVRATA